MPLPPNKHFPAQNIVLFGAVSQPRPGHGSEVRWRQVRSGNIGDGTGFDRSTGAGGNAGRATGGTRPAQADSASSGSSAAILFIVAFLYVLGNADGLALNPVLGGIGAAGFVGQLDHSRFGFDPSALFTLPGRVKEQAQTREAKADELPILNP